MMTGETIPPFSVIASTASVVTRKRIGAALMQTTARLFASLQRLSVAEMAAMSKVDGRHGITTKSAARAA